MALGRFRGLRFEILGNLAVVSVISLVLTGFGVWFISGRQMVQQNLARARGLAASLAEEAEGILSVLDPVEGVGEEHGRREARGRLGALLHRYKAKAPGMEFCIVDPAREVLSATRPTACDSRLARGALSACLGTGNPTVRLQGKPGWLGYVHGAAFSFPLRKNGAPGGALLALVSLDDVLAAARQSVRFILLYMTLGALVFLFFGTILLSRTVVNPLEKMIRVMQRVAEGDLQQRIEPTGNNEVGLLARTFNTMAGKLKAHETAVREHLARLERMNQELKETQQEVIQSEKLASVGLLAAGVAHEIGNPLGAILGYISILESGNVEPEVQKDYLRRMESEVLRIDGIVRGLRDYSRPSPRRVVPSDVNEVVRDTVSLVRRQREFRGIRFELALEPSLPMVRLDPGQFQQVLVNLFLNAKDSMESNGTLHLATRRGRYRPADRIRTAGPPRRRDDPPGVDYRLLRKGQRVEGWPFREGQDLVEVEVCDTGPGIPEKVLPRVFDPFFTTKEAGMGTGLGLSVSQRIVESFHGDIEITNRVGGGVRVRIRLPAIATEQGLSDPASEEMRDDGTAAAHR